MSTQSMIIDPNYEGNLFDGFPILKEHQGLIEEDVFRYLALSFDPNSPLVKLYPDIRERKKQALSKIGLKEDVPTVIAIWFLQKVVKKRDWIFIITLENNYEEYIQILNVPVNIDDQNELIKTVELKGKLRAQADEMRRQLPDLYKSFFDNDKDLEDGLSNSFDTPESIAKATRRNR